jgi:hypothetical protein
MTTAAKHTLFSILSALMIGGFASGCGDTNQLSDDGGPTLAATDDDGTSDGGIVSAPRPSATPPPDGGRLCGCAVQAGKFGKICLPCP